MSIAGFTRAEMIALATKAWGAPNQRLSTKTELRFGANGSKSLKPDAGIFFDHEVNAGGGGRDLYKLVHGDYPANDRGGNRVFRIPPGLKALGPTVAMWDYHDANGTIVARVVRFEPPTNGTRTKTFRQCQPDGDGWKWSVKCLRIPLYRLPELLAAPVDKVIYVVEGEKHADALAAWGLVATTNPMGAGKFRRHHAESLAGRNVVILPDNDDAGRDHAKRVMQELHQVDATVRLIELPGLPKKGDIVDWIAAGHTAEELATLVAATSPRVKPPAPEGRGRVILGDMPAPETGSAAAYGEIVVPPGYALTEHGLFFTPPPEKEDQTPKPIFICGPFVILGEARDTRSREWGLAIRWEDRDGITHQWSIPKAQAHGETADTFRELESCGLTCATSQRAHGLFRRFLVTAAAGRRLRCVARSGWHRSDAGMVFILPDGSVIGADADSIILQADQILTADGYAPSGSLAEWQHEIARYAIDNDLLAFCAAVAFTGPVLELIGEAANTGFNLNGPSQTGKTTLQRVACGVWGINKENTPGTLLRSWRATGNGLEATAAEANDLLLALNEASEVSAREIGEIVYMIGNGSGKQRAARTGGGRARTAFRLMALSSGEVTLAGKLAEAGLRSHAGQEVRLIEIDADPGAGMGVFQHLHGRASGGALAEALNGAASRLYGTAGRAFLAALVAERAGDEAALLLRLREMVNVFLDGRLPAGSAPAVRSVARRFGLVAAAGELAIQYGILPWPKGEAMRGVGACFKRWLQGRRGKSGSFEDAAMLAQVRAFIEAHGEARFTQIIPATDRDEERLSDRPTVNRAGFRQFLPTQRWRFMVLPEQWRDEVCKGFDPNRVARLMAKLGFLERGDGKNLTIRAPTVIAPNRPRVYSVLDLILEGEDDADA